MAHQNKKRTHNDMLHLCCGICGIKKKPEQLRKITDNVLSKIKKMEGYENYNLQDERYPKVICIPHMNSINNFLSKSNVEGLTIPNKFPFNVPIFHTISMPHPATRNNSTDFDSDHTCFMCEQNFVGRPKRKQTEENPSKKICTICFQEIGRGIPHPCTKSNRDTVNSLVSAIENMDGNVKDRVVHKILQNKMTPLNKSASVSNAIELKTYGKSSRISLNPKLNIEKKYVNCDV